MKNIVIYSLGLFLYLNAAAQLTTTADTIHWWKANNLRLIQVNLPAYKAATRNPDSLVKNLLHHSANTRIINAGKSSSPD